MYHPKAHIYHASKYADTPKVSREEMNDAAEAAQQGDEEAADRLAYYLQPYVIGQLRDKRSGDFLIKGDYSEMERDDMTQAAWCGAWKALANWDPTRKVEARFSTFAYHYIRAEIQQWVADYSGVLPVHRNSFRRAKAVEEEVDRRNEGRHPTEYDDAELAAIEGLVDHHRRYNIGAVFRARQQAYDPKMSNPDWDPTTEGLTLDGATEAADDLDGDTLDTIEAAKALWAAGNAYDAAVAIQRLVERWDLGRDTAQRIKAEVFK